MAIFVHKAVKRSSPISDEHVRSELRSILTSNGFFRAPRMQRFLTFVVEGTLTGKSHSEDLKESVVGMAVFDRNADYDPKSDPVVRVEARRLRAKLEEYYEGPGKNDPIRIDLPKGSYVPCWEWLVQPPIPVQQPRTPETRKWLLLASVALAVLLIGLIVFLTRRGWRSLLEDEKGIPHGKIRSLAILPFRNLSADSSKTYLVDGLTDELTTELAKIPGLKVISRTSADQYRATSKHLPQIAHELNVDAVVEGTLLSSPGYVRVSAQLIRAATDSHVWAETYQKNGADFFTLNKEIAEDIAQQIGVALRPAPEGGINEQPTSTEAYEAYLRGRYFWNKRTLDGLNKSIAYYQRAIQLDPKYGKAYAALGDSYVLLSSYGGPSPSESLLHARQAAKQALLLDSGLAEAHTVLAAVKLDYDWDWQGATSEFRRALQLSPGYPTAHHWYALHLSRLGRNKDAESEIKRAVDLDPLSLIIMTDAGETFYAARDPDQALVYLRRALELDPNFAEAHLVLGKVYEEKHDFAQATAEFDMADKLFGGAPNTLALKGHALALAGKQSEAIAIAIKLERASVRRYVSGVDIALVYCGLREPVKAMRWLDEAFTTRGKGLNILASDPLFDGCRSDTHFKDLLSRLKLEQP